MATLTAAVEGSEAMWAELGEELRQAPNDFVCRDFVDLTMEELDRCIGAAGWPRYGASSERRR
jgi:hypothetical protein